jgi:hypothetical protein
VPENADINDTKSVKKGISVAEIEGNLGKQTHLDISSKATTRVPFIGSQSYSTNFCSTNLANQPLKVVFIFTAGGSGGRGDNLSRVSGARQQPTANGSEFWKSIPSNPFPSKGILVNRSTLASDSKTLSKSNLPALEPLKPFTSNSPNSLPETGTRIRGLRPVFDSVLIQPNLPYSPSSLNQELQGVIPQNMPVVPSASRVEIPTLSSSLLDVKNHKTISNDTSYWEPTGGLSTVVAGGPRLKKKVPYKGKVIKICLPESVNLVQSGEAPKPMREKETEGKLARWDYDAAVPFVEKLKSQTCDLWPPAADMELERQSRPFRVGVPSPEVWRVIMAEASLRKLRQLGVEVPQTSLCDRLFPEPLDIAPTPDTFQAKPIHPLKFDSIEFNEGCDASDAAQSKSQNPLPSKLFDHTPSPDSSKRMSIFPLKFNNLVFRNGVVPRAEAQSDRQFDIQEQITGSFSIGRLAEPNPSKSEARAFLPGEIMTDESRASCELDAGKKDSLLNDPIMSEPPYPARMPDTSKQEPLPVSSPTALSATISPPSASDRVQDSIQIQDFTSGLEIPLSKPSEPAVEAPTSCYPPNSLLSIEVQSQKTSPDLVNPPSPEISDPAALPAISSHKEMSHFNLDFMPLSPNWKEKLKDSSSVTSRTPLRIIGNKSGFVFGAECKVPPKSFDYDTWSKFSYAARLPDKISFRDKLGTEMRTNSNGDTGQIQEPKEDLLWEKVGQDTETAVESENELLIGMAPTTAGEDSVSHHEEWKSDSERPKTPGQTSQSYPNEGPLTPEATPELASLSNHVNADASNLQSTPGIEEESDVSSIAGENNYLAPKPTAEHESVPRAAAENIFGNVVNVSTQSYQMHLSPDRTDILPHL